MFHSPWYFLLLLLIPVIVWRYWAARKVATVPFSSIGFARKIRPTWRQRLRWLPPALTIAAIALMVLGLARPREGRNQTIAESEGIAIEMVVDRSGSMQAMDFQIDGQHVDRLTAIKDVAGKFVTGDDKLEGRFSDLVGLITFAGYADAITPPTLDHPYLVSQLNQLQIVTNREEDGTAIGDAISLAVEKLSALDERQKEEVKSKIMILLTDGENNAGDFDPIQAAELAETLGIKIYTIGVGTKGRAPVPVVDGFTGRKVLQWMDVNIDEDTLKKVAELTHGKYFRATDTESLAAIYNEIDQLEKTKVESRHYVDYEEWAIQPFQTKYASLPPILLLAFICLVARFLLNQTIFKEFA